VNMNVVLEHLRLRLRPLCRALERAVERRAASSDRTVAKGVEEVCVTAEDARLTVGEIARRLRDGGGATDTLELDMAERALEKLLRARAEAAGLRLPLDALAALGLDAEEIAALLVIVAAELDAGYEVVFGYLVDDLARRFASAELVACVLARGVEGELALRRKLGPAARLQLLGLVEESGERAHTSRHVVLQPTQRVRRFLLEGHGIAAEIFVDAAECSTRAEPGPGVHAAAFEALASALGEGSVKVAGVWGSAASARDDAVRALAGRAGMRLRRIDLAAPARSFALAEACGALLWVDADSLGGEALDGLTQRALGSHAAVCLAGSQPVRPLPLILEKRFAELQVADPSLEERAALWHEAAPALAAEDAASLAARLRLDPPHMRAAARVAATLAELAGAPNSLATLEGAVGAVTRAQSRRFTTLVEPRRTPADLILPATTLRAVMEVIDFFRASAEVSERWGMGHMVTGGGGIKALFTGDSGTGKTLAAEVIAGELGLGLLRVDLARVVSKWVGETEQNLEVTFREAEASHAVLFFDEADALFGKRGQVQKGSDRYANLEVSYLLQRLEDYAGVALLATNLRDNVDKAFTRRFQVVVQFPRPGHDERLRIWRRAFPERAPLAEDVDLELLARLDMTGASIVASARTAALIAAQRRATTIGMGELVAAIGRQYHREARILTPRELGPYAAMMEA
jgi:hypothetical protein